MSFEISCHLTFHVIWRFMSFGVSCHLAFHVIRRIWHLAFDISWYLTFHDIWNFMTFDISWHLTFDDIWHFMTFEISWQLTCHNIWHFMTFHSFGVFQGSEFSENGQIFNLTGPIHIYYIWSKLDETSLLIHEKLYQNSLVLGVVTDSQYFS